MTNEPTDLEYEPRPPYESQPQYEPQPQQGARWRGCLIEIVETVLLTVVIFFLVQHFVAQPYRIYQVSMEHTLEPDQMVLVDKLTPIFSDYKRGDVIVFSPPSGYQDQQNDPFIKRVIGLPGDLVQIRDDGVYVNGVKLNEPYVYDGQPTTPRNDQSSWVVPAGEYFVMGDHREESEDSRVFGPIPRSTVIGRALVRYWPLADLGWISPATYANIPNPTGTPPPAPQPSPLIVPSASN
jgi:signal peptidase I